MNPLVCKWEQFVLSFDVQQISNWMLQHTCIPHFSVLRHSLEDAVHVYTYVVHHSLKSNVRMGVLSVLRKCCGGRGEVTATHTYTGPINSVFQLAIYTIANRKAVQCHSIYSCAVSSYYSSFKLLLVNFVVAVAVLAWVLNIQWAVYLIHVSS